VLSALAGVIYVEGIDQLCQHIGSDEDGDDAGPVSVHLGHANLVQANHLGRNGTGVAEIEDRGDWSFIGVRVRIAANVQLTLDSAFN
jgi:hypothetical protein